MASSAAPLPRSQPRWWLLSPLALTLLPLLYSAPALKSRPALRTGLFAGAVGLGLLHGATLILSSGGARADPLARGGGSSGGGGGGGGGGGEEEPLAPVRAAPRARPVVAAAQEAAR
jgi:hypothetical protein